MKAFLLAGGVGERLRPLTLSMPKCLVPIDGVPLLTYWLDLCVEQGISHVLLNVSRHPGQVRALLDARASGPDVTLVVEDEPCGTAGIVLRHRGFVGDDASVWVFYADNLTDVRLQPMWDAHQRHGRLVTMGLFRAPDPTAAGIVELDEAGTVVRFTEKPRHPVSDLANAGIYLIGRGLIDRIPVGPTVVDFGHDVFPSLAGEIHGHVIEQFVMDIGTPQALARASDAWRNHRSRRTGQ